MVTAEVAHTFGSFNNQLHQGALSSSSNALSNVGSTDVNISIGALETTASSMFGNSNIGSNVGTTTTPPPMGILPVCSALFKLT